MKLKTKFQDEDFDLGEVVEAEIFYGGGNGFKVEARAAKGRYHEFYCGSLKELTDMFEDYEEPKEYWYMDYGGRIKPMNDANDEEDVARKQIGNYFETQEEAEKAVEKLEAWTRLKDGGITFKNWTINQTGTIDCFATWGDNIPPSRKAPTLLKDLNLLFGGEE